jgi:hypothetical protein
MCHVGRGSDEGLTLVLRIDELKKENETQRHNNTSTTAPI